MAQLLNCYITIYIDLNCSKKFFVQTVEGSAELKVMVEDQSVTSTVNYATSPFVDEASITLTEEIIDEGI